jgi:predicted ATPase
VPQLKEFKIVSDIMGVPHLQAIYSHWRAKGAKQREDQFSDGTLRLIGLLWALLDGEALLLLEEPELSLHSAIVSKISSLIYQVQRKKKRQVMLSTHSFELLDDAGISGEEVLLLSPTHEGTKIEVAAGQKEIRTMLSQGFSIADVVLPKTRPEKVSQLSLFQ